MTNQPYYETMYILRPDIAEDAVESHLTKYSELVTEAGAEVLDSQMRGKRRLAYPIAKHKEGIYVQLSHNGNGQHVEKLEKAMRLSEDVIRYLTVKQEGPLPAPRVVQGTEAASQKEKQENTEAKDIKENKESKDIKENTEVKDIKENKESKDIKETQVES